MLLHKKTAAAIEIFCGNPAHALGVIGEPGAGKTYICEEIVQRILGISEEQLQTYPYLLRIIPDEKGVITIDQAHEVVQFVRLKTTGSLTKRRIIMVEHANSMTIEAQNTLLKVIEEPPEDTILLLTLNSKTAILPTILSRIQLLEVHVPTDQQITEYYKDFNESKRKKAMQLSGGRIGLLHALLNEEDDHPLVKAINEAKNLLTLDTYDRLSSIDNIVKRKKSVEIVQALQQVAQAAVYASAKDRSKERSLQKWAAILSACTTAQDALLKNGQPKLTLTNLFLQI